MDHYPYLHVARGRLLSHDTEYTVRDVAKHLPKDAPLYLLDTDGIATNRPNYNTYQRLSSQADLWIDAGPRDINDLVDLVMAGATAIIIRPTLWPNPDINAILDVTDLNLYTYYDHESITIPPHINGLIIPYTGEPLPNRPLQHTTLPLYLLNLTNTNQYPHETTLTAAFLDYPLLAQGDSS